VHILFITHESNSPSARWRVLQLLPYLEKEGIHFERYVLPNNPLRRYFLFKRARLFSVTFLQKRLISRFWLKLLRKHSKKLIYEFDDAVFLDSKTLRLSQTRNKRFQQTVKAADCCITTNNYLATYARKFCWNVKILPNAVDLSRWKIKSAKKTEQITIGFIGSGSTAEYLLPLAEKFSFLCELYPQIKFKIISDKPIKLKGVRTEYKPFNPKTEVEDVHSFDIGIAPYPENAWTMGKFPVKVLTYMACGLPVIASDVTSVKKIIQDGESGLLARTKEDWERKIALLIESPGLQTKLGINARKRVENIYSLDKVAKGYVSVLQSLVK